MPFLPQAMDYPRECAAICPDKALGRRTDQLIQDGQHIEVGKLETCKVVEMIAEDQLDLAVRVLHTAFGLDSEEAA